MARIAIPMPNVFPFAMQMTIPIAFINRGNHLGNDALVSCLNEARLAFMQHFFAEPYGIAGGAMINADLAIEYKAEAYHGEELNIDVAIGDVYRHGCDFLYRVSVVKDGRVVAHAKTGMLLFDLQSKKLLELPESVKLTLQQGQAQE